jgi:hypothetical protein
LFASRWHSKAILYQQNPKKMGVYWDDEVLVWPDAVYVKINIAIYMPIKGGCRVVVRFEMLPDEATLVCTASGEITEADALRVKAFCFALYEQMQRHIYVIFDGRRVVLNFSQMMLVLSYISRTPHDLTRLPLTVYNVVDFEHPIMRLGFNVIRSGQYGIIDIRMAETVEEAHAKIRALQTPPSAP